MIRKHFVFTGKVQHVGFRWRARKAANRFRCTGWCRNESDGSVTMELQGSKIRIDLVILAIRSADRIRVDRMDSTVIATVPDEQGFQT